MLINKQLNVKNISFFSAKLRKKRKFANHTEQITSNIINTYQKITKYLNNIA